MNELRIYELYINEISVQEAHPLDLDTINSVVDEKRKGNYALGYIDKRNIFIPKYVGKGNIHERLRKHIKKIPKQPQFKFIYIGNKIESYNLECRMYHEYLDQLINEYHPGLPEGIKCLYCNHIGGKYEEST